MSEMKPSARSLRAASAPGALVAGPRARPRPRRRGGHLVPGRGVHRSRPRRPSRPRRGPATPARCTRPSCRTTPATARSAAWSSSRSGEARRRARPARRGGARHRHTSTRSASSSSACGPPRSTAGPGRRRPGGRSGGSRSTRPASTTSTSRSAGSSSTSTSTSWAGRCGAASRSSPSTARSCSPRRRSTCSPCGPAEALAGGGALTGDGDDLVESARAQAASSGTCPSARSSGSSETGEPSEDAHHLLADDGRGDEEGRRLGHAARRAGDMPYEITDLVAGLGAGRRLRDRPAARAGGHAGHPDPEGRSRTRTFQGKVVFIDPLLDPRPAPPRSASHFANPGGELKPEMFGEVVLAGRAARGAAHPRRRGHRLGHQEGGLRRAGRGQVPAARGPARRRRRRRRSRCSAGSRPGEQVVTRANFLVDSESRCGPRSRRIGREVDHDQARSSASRAENKYLVIAATLVPLALACWSMRNIPLDALPDLSDTQVIVYSRWDRSPDIIEDQVTYPDHHRAARRAAGSRPSAASPTSASATSTSSSRTAPTCTGRAPASSSTCPRSPPQLPAGREDRARPRRHQRRLGLPVRAGRPERHAQPRDELRSYQDWFLRYAVQSVPGVAEVATVGGQVRQYQITVNPNALAAYKLPLEAVINAVRQGQQRRGRAARRALRPRVHGARPRLREVASPTSRSWCSRPRAARPSR